jgi:hypothetical protein
VFHKKGFDKRRTRLNLCLLHLGPICVQAIISELKIALCCAHFTAFDNACVLESGSTSSSFGLPVSSASSEPILRIKSSNAAAIKTAATFLADSVSSSNVSLPRRTNSEKYFPGHLRP